MGSNHKINKSDVRHEAAIRAWETRREQARKRSEAAKKAWRTRKRQSRQ
jgi:hypothetical protein